MFCSPLLYIENKSTLEPSTFTKVIILAPPDLPLPLELIDKLILYILLPRGMPKVGLTSSSFIKLANSDFNEAYFLMSFFASFLKLGDSSML